MTAPVATGSPFPTAMRPWKSGHPACRPTSSSLTGRSAPAAPTALQQKRHHFTERRIDARRELRTGVPDSARQIAWRGCIEHIGRSRIHDVRHLTKGYAKPLGFCLHVNIVELWRDRIGRNQRLRRTERDRKRADDFRALDRGSR